MFLFSGLEKHSTWVGACEGGLVHRRLLSIRDSTTHVSPPPLSKIQIQIEPWFGFPLVVGQSDDSRIVYLLSATFGGSCTRSFPKLSGSRISPLLSLLSN